MKTKEIDGIGLFMEGYTELVVKFPGGDVTVTLDDKVGKLAKAMMEASIGRGLSVPPTFFPIELSALPFVIDTTGETKVNHPPKRIGEYYKEIIDDKNPSLPPNFFTPDHQVKSQFLNEWNVEEAVTKHEKKVDGEFAKLVADVYSAYDGVPGGKYADTSLVMGGNTLNGLFHSSASTTDFAFAFPILYAMRERGFTDLGDIQRLFRLMRAEMLRGGEASMDTFRDHKAEILLKVRQLRKENSYHNDTTAFLALLGYGDTDDFYSHPIWDRNYQLKNDPVLWRVVSDKNSKQLFGRVI